MELKIRQQSYLRLYHSSVTAGDKEYSEYRIDIGLGSNRNRVLAEWGDLVECRRIPGVWNNRLSETVHNILSIGDIWIGDISYSIDRREGGMLAVSCEYTPKMKMVIAESFAGMPYFMEAMAVSHLKSLGVEQVSTSASPSRERIKQLRRVELPINRRTGIGIWLRGLGRGINEAAREAVHNRHMPTK